MPQFALPPQPPVPVSARPALSASATPLATPVARRRAVVRRPARMLVFASEYKLQPSRRVVPAGRVIIQTKNIGEDDHNLAVRAANGHVLKVTPVIRSGGLATLRLSLRPGRYWLVCTIPGHEAHGMVRAFIVKRPVRKVVKRVRKGT